MEADSVKKMFSIIIGICERTFFLNQQYQSPLVSNQLAEIFDEKVYQLPSFIESLACVCNQIEESLPEGSVATLERLVLLAIDSYPKLIKRYNHQISLAVAQLFIAIQLGKAGLYGEFVARVVYQSMIRIFSYRTNYFMQQQQPSSGEKTRALLNEDADVDMATDESNRSIYNITSTDYVQFWSNLLSLTEFKEFNAIGVSISDREKLAGIVYDEYVKTVLNIMSKLELSAVKIENENERDGSSSSSVQQSELVVSSNPIAGLRPVNFRDQEILVNLVDFSKYVNFAKKKKTI
jgi:hypothetical protein